jgi:hypothetical protein
VQQDQDLFNKFQQQAAAEDLVQYFVLESLVKRDDIPKPMMCRLDKLHTSYSVFLAKNGTRIVPQLARLKAKLAKHGVEFSTIDGVTYCTSHVHVHEGESQ